MGYIVPLRSRRPRPARLRSRSQLDRGCRRAVAVGGPHVLVVLDDDPTGTQSVADLPVLTRWEVSDFG